MRHGVQTGGTATQPIGVEIDWSESGGAQDAPRFSGDVLGMSVVARILHGDAFTGGCSLREPPLGEEAGHDDDDVLCLWPDSVSAEMGTASGGIDHDEVDPGKGGAVGLGHPFRIGSATFVRGERPATRLTRGDDHAVSTGGEDRDHRPMHRPEPRIHHTTGE